MTSRRAAFTLFELILAIALSAVLLTLIGTAINLYLTRVDAGRSRVEEAQLARSILAMIADDIRATTIYQPQDTSAIAQLMAKSSTFDVDSIDKPRESSGDSGGGSSAASATSAGSGAMSSISSGTGSSTSSQGSSGSSSNNQSESDDTLPLGLNGTHSEVFVDATRLPRQEELFAAATGYTNAQSPAATGGAAAGTSAAAAAGFAPPSDVKTVRYFVRAGAGIESGSAGATSLDPATQLQAGGLVRQEMGRSPREFAEKTGSSGVLYSGAALIAPEVMQVEFRYFNAGEVVDVWDMKERKSLPMAVEVAIWLRSTSATDQPITANYDAVTLASSCANIGK